MRRVLRVLGSRYGLAALMLLLVVGVVSVAKALDNSGPNSTTSNSSTITENEPGVPNDGVVGPDGDPVPESPLGESPESALPPEAIEVAVGFTNEWLDTDRTMDEWHVALSGYASDGLMVKLMYTRPDAVPSTEVRGEPIVSNTGVEFDTDAGLLILRVVQEEGKWMVDGIDFEKPSLAAYTPRPLQNPQDPDIRLERKSSHQCLASMIPPKQPAMNPL